MNEALHFFLHFEAETSFTYDKEAVDSHAEAFREAFVNYRTTSLPSPAASWLQTRFDHLAGTAGYRLRKVLSLRE